jgi:hypothetical protein
MGIRKKLKIEKSRGFLYKGVNKAHIVVELTILGVFLILLWYIERPFPAFITFSLFYFCSGLLWNGNLNAKKRISS